MGLLLVRHAEAVAAAQGLEDSARWLSASGRSEARASAALLAAKALHFERFFTSPRVRAVQTAELFAMALGFAGVVEVMPELSYTVPAREAVRALQPFTGNVAAFGHMPTLGEIAQRLGNTPHALAFATSEALWIDNGQVRWRSAPER